ncbi:MAG: metallophosphoesterase [Labilithrix sp.]|nr:metallophosphoesterase [Labilithrix sp.]
MQRLTGFVSLMFVVGACGGEGASSGSGGPPDESSSSGGSSSSSSSSSSSGGDPVGGGDGGSSGGIPAAPKSVRFIAMGDTGTGSNAQLKIGNAIAAHCKARGCDFVQLLGDNLYDSGASSANDPIFQSHFEVPYAAVDLDFWIVLGNHDYGHDGLGTDFPRGQNEIAYTANSTKWKLPSAYWHHVPPAGEGVLETFGLDTNMAMFGQDSAQRKDVSAWIAASTAEWKIAFGHHPYKSNGPHGNAGRYDARLDGLIVPPAPANGQSVKSYLEDTICGKVDLYLSGHDHSRQWLNESCKGTELAVSGAGAKATKLGGKNASLFESLALGFLYIVIEGKKLTAEFIDENGKTEFTHTTVKP